ncbi:unnamed protein product [Ectocarpus sp. 4 AP-2014]
MEAHQPERQRICRNPPAGTCQPGERGTTTTVGHGSAQEARYQRYRHDGHRCQAPSSQKRVLRRK